MFISTFIFINKIILQNKKLKMKYAPWDTAFPEYFNLVSIQVVLDNCI